MDMMLLGELVESASADDKYRGFWMPASGNDGVAAIEVYYLSSSTSFQVLLETKSSDEVDTAAASIGSANVTSAGITKFDVSNAKDLVRYTITRLDAGLQSMHMQLSQPLWSPN